LVEKEKNAMAMDNLHALTDFDNSQLQRMIHALIINIAAAKLPWRHPISPKPMIWF
jgi:hypothetical protein